MLVRGPSLAESMSQYLIDRIEATDNIEVLTQTEIVALYGSRERQLERVRWRNNVTGEQTEKPIRHVFLFIGADPATIWLKDSGIALDDKNFILTGSDVPSDVRQSSNRTSRPLPLETSVRNVFAIGDVRSGSSQAGGRGNRRGSSRCGRTYMLFSQMAPLRRDSSIIQITQLLLLPDARWSRAGSEYLHIDIPRQLRV